MRTRTSLCRSLMAKSSGLKIATLAALSVLWSVPSVADEVRFSVTGDGSGVVRKVLVSEHGARLYPESAGGSGRSLTFMSHLFAVEVKRNGIWSAAEAQRIPVARDDSRARIDGWVERSDVTEWDTNQLVYFAESMGRDPLLVFSSASCARAYGKSASVGRECVSIGSEPPRLRDINELRFLIPVHGSAFAQGVYEASFVEVARSSQDPRIPHASSSSLSEPVEIALGLDLVLVIDSTKSMKKYFKPTIDAIRNLFKHASPMLAQRETPIDLRVGLLFYRDRLNTANCDMEYLTKIRVNLASENVEQVAQQLGKEETTHCESGEDEEAVLDGIARAVDDFRWKNEHFKLIVVVGDSPAHTPSNLQKNPFGYSLERVGEKAWERGIRFLMVKIDTQAPDSETDRIAERQYRILSMGSGPMTKGRFVKVPREEDTIRFRTDLATGLTREWNLVCAAARILTSMEAEADQEQIAASINSSAADLDLPVILANLPRGTSSGELPSHRRAWAARKIKGRAALREYVLMKQVDGRIFANTLDSVAAAIERGTQEGPAAFARAVRKVVEASLGQSLSDGDTIGSVFEKAFALPFRTTATDFTIEEVRTWSSKRYEQVLTVIQEKVLRMRTYVQNPMNRHRFGKVDYVFVPREVIP
jgi:hypothetical protein